MLKVLLWEMRSGVSYRDLNVRNMGSRKGKNFIKRRVREN